MKTKVAINGFGRIGRNAFKIAFERSDLEVVAINDLTDNTTLAHLLKHDTNYGLYEKKIEADDDGLTINGIKIKVLSEKDPSVLPWADLGVDVVIESTGRFTKTEDASMHLKAGAKKVVISAPAKSQDTKTIVIGVNEDELTLADNIISNASCTTNCIAPIVSIIDQQIGIEKALMTTIHSYTSSQSLQDGPSKDLREGRSAAENMVPTTTGAAIATTLVVPNLAGMFNGISVRVPTPVVSLSDITMLLKQDVTKEELNQILVEASQQSYYQGILAVTDEELVSSDYVGNSHSTIVDLKLTNVVGGNLAKVVAWYDNEWGYSNRLVEITADIGKLIQGE